MRDVCGCSAAKPELHLVPLLSRDGRALGEPISLNSESSWETRSDEACAMCERQRASSTYGPMELENVVDFFTGQTNNVTDAHGCLCRSLTTCVS